MRLGVDDFHPDGVTFDESIVAIGWLKEHGLDLADISIGGNTDDMVGVPWNDWAWWLRNLRGHGPSIGWPDVVEPADLAELQLTA